MADDILRIIKADRIFRSSEEYRRPDYLVMRNGLIEAVSGGLPAHQKAEIIDFTGFSITPLFCDYHLHFPAAASTDSELIARNLLQSGIQKVFEGGDRYLTGMKIQGLLRNRIEVRTSGYALYKKGTYGKQIGYGVEGPAEAREVIDYLCENGIDYIKLINSGILRPETGEITRGGFERGELIEIIGYVKERGLRSFCHANGIEKIRDAVLAGVSGIIHGFYISDEILGFMARRGIAFIPTVNAFEGLSEVISVQARRNLERAVRTHLLKVKMAGEKGVKVLPGSDSGPGSIPYGRSYIKELHLFRKAGLSVDDILASACTGSLTVGTPADFLVLDGLEIKKVFLSGECFSGEP
jgi:imidazolonepropionase-like amidohydrolase